MPLPARKLELKVTLAIDGRRMNEDPAPLLNELQGLQTFVCVMPPTPAIARPGVFESHLILKYTPGYDPADLVEAVQLAAERLREEAPEVSAHLDALWVEVL